MSSATASPAIGAVAPLFDPATSVGAELRGHPVVLAFHPSGWDPSRADQLAHFNALLQRLPGTHAELLDASDDARCHVAIDDDEIRLPMLGNLDSCGETAARFGVNGEPAVFVIDADGLIRWSHVGAMSAHKLDAFIDALTSCDPAKTPQDATVQPEPWQPDGDDQPRPLFMPTRRDFVSTLLAAAVLLAARPFVAKAEQVTNALTPAPAPAAMPVMLNINGRDMPLTIEPRVTLLDALREYAGLTGTKKGCDHGQCGACTVHVDGRRQLSCMTFAIMTQGKKITTVEGLASGDTLHPMQAAFIKHDGFQCGYCTPGQLMSATALLKEPCGSADADVKECMSGNICRCGAYPGIVAAIQEVRRS